jgi:hypothetical protein
MLAEETTGKPLTARNYGPRYSTSRSHEAIEHAIAAKQCINDKDLPEEVRTYFSSLLYSQITAQPPITPFLFYPNMAPALTQSASAAPHTLGGDGTALNKTLFPDGLKTSGQHNPIYELLRPYSDFPKEITGPTVWKAEDYRNNPERWTHVFSDEEIAELGAAADAFIASGVPLTGMTRARFLLPKLESFFGAVRNEILNGKGFILFKGFPVQEWGLQKSATAYMGLGAYFGYFVSQNSRGHVLGHVKDLGEDPTQKHTVRIYRTNAKYARSSSFFRSHH